MQKQSINKDNYVSYLTLRKEWVIYHDQVIREFDKFVSNFKNLNYTKFYEYRDMYRNIYDGNNIIYPRDKYNSAIDYHKLIMCVEKMLNFQFKYFPEVLKKF
jgi:hypothetical protein